AGDSLRAIETVRGRGYAKKKWPCPEEFFQTSRCPFFLCPGPGCDTNSIFPPPFALSQDLPMKHFLVACLCATVCLSPARGQSSEQKQQTVLALQGLQARDGGFLPVFAPGSKPAPKSSLQ